MITWSAKNYQGHSDNMKRRTTRGGLTSETQKRNGAVAKRANRVKSLVNRHSWSKMLAPLPIKTDEIQSLNGRVATMSQHLHVDSAKPRPPYTGAKYLVGRALIPPRSRSRGAGARFAFEPIRHPQSEPPGVGPALGSDSGIGSISSSLSASTTSKAEFVADVIAGLPVPAMLGPGVIPVSESR